VRIAVVGSGIAGFSAAWFLDSRHDVVLLEKDERLGGHSHTVTVETNGRSIDVDTGFIVYNERNYPQFARFLETLDVPTEPSCMSFSASLDDGRFEYSGKSIAALVAQKRNLARPTFARMLIDIARFNRLGLGFLERTPDNSFTLGMFLDLHRFGVRFRSAYLLPMAAAIWSAPLDAILDFPAQSFLRFFDNHGLLTIADQPSWRTLSGRSRDYVRRLAMRLEGRVRRGFEVIRVERCAAGVRLVAASGETIEADQAVLACHADQTLTMLADADPTERALLSAFAFQRNSAVLHADPSLMPKRRTAWASWNYVAPALADKGKPVSVTYWMNRLQNIDASMPLFVSLNPFREPDPSLVHRRMTYHHPLLNRAALDAQARIGEIQGRGGIWHAGAWLRYGFHEDGLVSSIDVARALGAPPPWLEGVRDRASKEATGMPCPAGAYITGAE